MYIPYNLFIYIYIALSIQEVSRRSLLASNLAHNELLSSVPEIKAVTAIPPLSNLIQTSS